MGKYWESPNIPILFILVNFLLCAFFSSPQPAKHRTLHLSFIPMHNGDSMVSGHIDQGVEVVAQKFYCTKLSHKRLFTVAFIGLFVTWDVYENSVISNLMLIAKCKRVEWEWDFSRKKNMVRSGPLMKMCSLSNYNLNIQTATPQKLTHAPCPSHNLMDDDGTWFYTLQFTRVKVAIWLYTNI